MTNEELLNRWRKKFGSRRVEEILKVRRKLSTDEYVRVNLSNSSLDEISSFLKDNRVKFSNTFLPNCLKIDKSFFNLSSSIPALKGEFYLQDIASQIPVNCIDFTKFKGREIKILDMAASPGSKTTQLADLFTFHEIQYSIVALEPEEKRLTKLLNNIQKGGFSNISVLNIRGEEFESSDKFDLILLDAPCSGNLIGDKEWLNKRNVRGILEMSKLQRKLLQKASELLAEDGLLIYSTCSIEMEENEENVSFAEKDLELRAFLPSLHFPFSVKPLIKGQNSIRIMPDSGSMQGFFVCCFKKRE